MGRRGLTRSDDWLSQTKLTATALDAIVNRIAFDGFKPGVFDQSDEFCL